MFSEYIFVLTSVLAGWGNTIQSETHVGLEPLDLMAKGKERKKAPIADKQQPIKFFQVP